VGDSALDPQAIANSSTTATGALDRALDIKEGAGLLEQAGTCSGHRAFDITGSGLLIGRPLSTAVVLRSAHNFRRGGIIPIEELALISTR